MATGYKVLFVVAPVEIRGTVAVYDGELKFLSGEITEEPYIDRFQKEVLGPLQGRKLKNPNTRGMLSPRDVATSREAHNAYGLALETEFDGKKFDGKPILCFSDI